jgi:amino acid transporter
MKPHMHTSRRSQACTKELKVVDAAAFSVGLIGPVGAIALLGTGAAGIIGRGVTLSFIFVLVGAGLVAYAFVRLSQHIAHTGSAYALVGVTLGPRFGFLAARVGVDRLAPGWPACAPSLSTRSASSPARSWPPRCSERSS